MTYKPLLAGLVAAAAVLPVPALAQSWYAGLSVGQSRTSDDLVRNRESTIVDGRDFDSAFDARDNAWKAFVGYRLNDIVSFELDYTDLGEHTLNTRFLGGTPPQPAQVVIAREVKGFGASLVLSAPISPAFTVFGKVGAYRAEIDASAQLSGNVVFTNGAGETFRSTSRSETVGRYGVGLQWAIARNIAVRAEVERHANIGKAFEVGGSGTTGEADTDLYTAGVVFRF